MEDTAMVVKQN